MKVTLRVSDEGFNHIVRSGKSLVGDIGKKKIYAKGKDTLPFKKCRVRSRQLVQDDRRYL
jgi:hypothetical protein